MHFRVVQAMDNVVHTFEFFFVHLHVIIHTNVVLNGCCGKKAVNINLAQQFSGKMVRKLIFMKEKHKTHQS